jgi:hypothetical protein
MDWKMNKSDVNAPQEDEEPKAPRKLVAAFRNLPARRIFVPPTVDEAVLRAAQKHLAKPGQSWWNGFSVFRRRLAIPATALILVMAMYLFLKPQPERRFAAEDLNRDGQVDILDAFQLARELSDSKGAAHDLNGDGVMDQKDVEILANQAVKLAKEGTS